MSIRLQGKALRCLLSPIFRGENKTKVSVCYRHSVTPPTPNSVIFL